MRRNPTSFTNLASMGGDESKGGPSSSSGPPMLPSSSSASSRSQPRGPRPRGPRPRGPPSGPKDEIPETNIKLTPLSNQTYLYRKYKRHKNMKDNNKNIADYWNPNKEQRLKGWKKLYEAAKRDYIVKKRGSSDLANKLEKISDYSIQKGQTDTDFFNYFFQKGNIMDQNFKSIGEKVNEVFRDLSNIRNIPTVDDIRRRNKRLKARKKMEKRWKDRKTRSNFGTQKLIKGGRRKRRKRSYKSKKRRKLGRKRTKRRRKH